MENTVRYNSTAVPVDRPPKTESTVYVQLYRYVLAVGSSQSIVCTLSAVYSQLYVPVHVQLYRTGRPRSKMLSPVGKLVAVANRSPRLPQEN